VRLIPDRESALLAPVARRFAEQGFLVGAEVDIAGRIADVVAVRDGEVVGVELKLRDWRAAGRQALAYQLGCHRTFVALPLLEASRLLSARQAEFQARFPGCGLLGVNHPGSEVRTLLDAGPNSRFLPFLSEGLAIRIASSTKAADPRAAP
jgi:hypothetical protein